MLSTFFYIFFLVNVVIHHDAGAGRRYALLRPLVAATTTKCCQKIVYIFRGLPLLMSPISYSLSEFKPKEKSARNQLSYPRWLHGSELNVLFDTLSRTASLHFQSNIHSNLLASTHRAIHNNRDIHWYLYQQRLALVFINRDRRFSNYLQRLSIVIINRLSIVFINKDCRWYL
jgi:hypothetical protein